MMLHRHDLLCVEPSGWDAMLGCHPGLSYLTSRSDLDLIRSISDERNAALLVEGLLRLDADGPVRLDGELELPGGAAVHRAFIAHRLSPGGYADLLAVTLFLDALETRS
jgi:triphosphoribosyl-dephospho-CoA synthetase